MVVGGDNLTTWKETLGFVGFLLVLGLILHGAFLLVSTAYSLYVNKIPKTHGGHIIYISYRYNKLYNYDWTDVEVLTYSGDSHHIDFWGHPEFELNTNYRIHTEIRWKFYLFPIPIWEGHELITKLEVIE